MNHSMNFHLLLTILLPNLEVDDFPDKPIGLPADEHSRSLSKSIPIPDYIQEHMQKVARIIASFRANAVTPTSTLHFEQAIQDATRELNRKIAEHTYNTLEPQDPKELPKHIKFEGTSYTNLNKKTPQVVWTLFGPIQLFRTGYRCSRFDGHRCLFPLAHCLGLLDGVSPALASHAGKVFATAGMTQQMTLDRLRAECGIDWSVGKLRTFTAALAERLKVHRHDCQVEQALKWLTQAYASQGKHRPVIAVGKDGITLAIRTGGKATFEVATTATLSIYDRNGKRIGTIYLAYTPQADQTRMNEELTRLIRAVLQKWKGQQPRLCYVSDAGTNETKYYQKVLAVMRHPVTKERLKWVRVLDYYHASQRIWTMAEQLFNTEQDRKSWARKMLKLMLRQDGVNRVLHSAAAYCWRLKLRGKKKEAFDVAYRYLSKRMKYMRYWQYREAGMPIGSGVTEAACKTVYTQRLKLSGMCWNSPSKPTKDGATAQTVLDLRVLLLSGVWDQTFLASLKTSTVVNYLTNRQTPEKNPANTQESGASE